MKNLIQNKTFYPINLGCRVNLFETTVITDELLKAGCIKAKSAQKAQIIIINTCSVTARADRKCRNYIQRANRFKQCEALVVMGCYSQIHWSTNPIKADIVIGNKYKNKIVDLLNEFYTTHKPITKISDLSLDRKFEKMSTYAFCDNTRAVIKIQDGCDFMCAYCLIPYARGRQRSLKHDLVIKMINQLVKQGFYEIVLTGVNTAGYHDGTYNFYDLLKAINNIKGNFRIRISSIEPFQISHQIIDLICHHPNRFCQHFHLCLQNANDEVLKAMHRKYTFAEFASLCEYIREQNPFASITTDYIVGYCNETQQMFNNSIVNLKKLQLSSMHIFPYSKRPLTLASYLPSVVTEQQKKQRLNKTSLLNQQNTNKYLKQFINKVVTVNFEMSNNRQYQCGHSQYFFKVYVPTKQSLQGQVLPVKITKVTDQNQVWGIIV